MFLQQQISSADQQFAPVKTSLATSKVTGAQRQSMLNSNSPFLTVFVSTNMDESLRTNPYSGSDTYFDSNAGTIQRIINSQAYNALMSFDFSASNELIPFSASTWNNVEDNKAVFLIFDAIRKASADDNIEILEDLWNKYLTVVERQLNSHKLIQSSILLASQNSLFAGSLVFANTKSSNPNYNGASIYGSKDNKSSFMPYTSLFTGTVKKTTTDFVDESVKALVKPNFVYGFHESKRNSSKTQEDSGVFDPAASLDDDSSITVTKSDDKKVQSFSSLLYIQDSNGRLSLLQGIVKDVKMNDKVIKRSDSFYSIEMDTELSILSAVLVPRSLNSGISDGRVGIIDGSIYGSLGVTFELFNLDYRSISKSDGITVNSISSDIGTMEELDGYLDMLGSTDSVVISDTSVSSSKEDVDSMSNDVSDMF